MDEQADAQRQFEQASRLLAQRDVRAALALFHSAEQLGHPLTECAASRWQCWMLLGDFESAWQESDRITACGVIDPHRFWDGSSWSGRRLMLRCLHGLGDTIQFIRYAALLRETCRELTVQVHPQLVRLIQQVPGVDRVVTWGDGYQEDRSSWDLQMEVNELPRAFRTVLGSIPSAVPYVSLPAESLEWAASRFGSDDRPRIGLIWKAGPWDAARSLGLADLELLLQLDSFQFIGLQKGSDARELASFPMVRDLEAHSKDVQDTAALMAQVDLVITVDTMTAHLAGALGKDVWILLPWAADWRWMLDGVTTPWYPTARLFRQRTAGDWGEVVKEVVLAMLSQNLLPQPRATAVIARTAL